MTTPCDNHPANAGENLCDSCDRYLCAECLGAPVNRPVAKASKLIDDILSAESLGAPANWRRRLYYFCNKEACRRAYRAKVKKEGFALAGLIVSALIGIVAGVVFGANLLDMPFVIWVSVTVLLTMAVKLWREYRQRQMQ
jgi:hypothetical protein